MHFSAGLYTEYPRLLSAYLAGKPLVSETLSPELEEGRHYIALGAQTNVEYFAKTFANFSAEFVAHNRFTDFLASYAKSSGSVIGKAIDHVFSESLNI